MDLQNSLYTSIFGMSVVFAALVSLILIINLQTRLTAFFSSRQKAAVIDTHAAENPSSDSETSNAPAGPPELKLIGVDERTAAIIMAIVCDECGYMPNELYFKSIRALEENQ